jgi:hypothetical protein
MKYQKRNSTVRTGNAMIKKEGYVITLCFQIDNDTPRGESCDISLTKNQLEILKKLIEDWLEFMSRNG